MIYIGETDESELGKVFFATWVFGYKLVVIDDLCHALGPAKRKMGASNICIFFFSL